jgi:hypothetical protein
MWEILIKNLKMKTGKKTALSEKINILGAITTPAELIRETLINFCWGFSANSVVVFMSRNIDIAVLLNFFVYYILISYIVNREKYETRLGKFIILPGSSAAGAFCGYKFAQYIAGFL